MTPAKTIWTPAMDAVIQKYLQRESRIALAIRLGVKKTSLNGRIERLGMCSPRTTWTQADSDFVIANINIMPVSAMAKSMSKGTSTIHDHIVKLGLTLPSALKPKRISRKSPSESSPERQPPKFIQRNGPAPVTARPWQDRKRTECAFLYGERGSYSACCAPVFSGSWCRDHAAVCYDGVV